MGHEHDGPAQLVLQAQEVVVELEARDLVERGERLVHQQQAGLGTSARAIETRIFMPPESSRG